MTALSIILAILPASFLTAVYCSACYPNVYLKRLEVTGFSIFALNYPHGESNSVDEAGQFLFRFVFSTDQLCNRSIRHSNARKKAQEFVFDTDE